ncbi:MAG: GTPase Era [Bacteroidota bacterium]|nr:GTPase Era [Bacteroidota bacterium]
MNSTETSILKQENFRCGYVVIVGEPNVGKSTLMNTLLGQKISIVTNKPQTTRHKLLGILSSESYQIIFLDTPGLLKPKYKLQSFMMDAAYSAINDADVVFMMVDAEEKVDKKNDYDITFDLIKKINKPTFLVINKVDLVKKFSLLPIIDFYSNKFPFVEIFPISALNGIGTDDLLKSVVDSLPLHPPYYPTDSVSDASERFFVSEIIREKIFEKYKQEIPYSTTVEIIEFKERKVKKDFISAEIYVERQSQKGILIGKKGEALKAIGESARADLEKFLGRSVFLDLHVKVREKWRDSEAWLNRLGYKS